MTTLLLSVSAVTFVLAIWCFYKATQLKRQSAVTVSPYTYHQLGMIDCIVKGYKAGGHGYKAADDAATLTFGEDEELWPLEVTCAKTKADAVRLNGGRAI